jgi:hypothetical protein
MDDAGTVRQTIWRELQRATMNRNHAWRTPVLATVDRSGMPQARTVVLREADQMKQSLAVYTDHRSPKVMELVGCPRAVFVFWSSVLNWQLRVMAEVSVEIDGGRVQRAWDQVRQTAGAGDYLSLEAPGSPLGQRPGDRAERHALGIIAAKVTSIDWLELSSGGHRRALLQGERLQWLVP